VLSSHGHLCNHHIQRGLWSQVSKLFFLYLLFFILHSACKVQNAESLVIGIKAMFLQENSLTTGRYIMGYNMNGAPMFNGQKGLKYELWSCRMKVCLQAQRYDV